MTTGAGAAGFGAAAEDLVGAEGPAAAGAGADGAATDRVLAGGAVVAARASRGAAGVAGFAVVAPLGAALAAVADFADDEGAMGFDAAAGLGFIGPEASLAAQPDSTAPTAITAHGPTPQNRRNNRGSTGSRRGDSVCMMGSS
ncbi:MAG: hypothetical protein K2X91_07070 [Thermoleophilia bacterium]|nr:hypothetical protein [Thermoleophilia bacterium]